MNGTLIKIDKNGTKYYVGLVTCDRCGGQGGADVWKYTGYTCYKCGGTGKVEGKWVERTPEYEAKLEAKRQAKREAQRKIWEQEEAEREAKREAERKAKEEEEARIAAQKAISQYVGEVGGKIECKATYQYSAHFDTHIQWMEVRMYIHNFKDENGNVLVWKTQSFPFDFEKGATVTIKGTVKGHSEYKDEKQTELTRCKVTI